MQELFIIEGVGAADLIPLLEQLGITGLQELQEEDSERFGEYHPQISNRSGGGEGVVRGARRYVLYLVTVPRVEAAPAAV